MNHTSDMSLTNATQTVPDISLTHTIQTGHLVKLLGRHHMANSNNHWKQKYTSPKTWEMQIENESSSNDAPIPFQIAMHTQYQLVYHPHHHLYYYHKLVYVFACVR